MHLTRWLGLILAGVPLVLLSWWLYQAGWARVGPTGSRSPGDTSTSGLPKVLGGGSCSGLGCHGGPERSEDRGVPQSRSSRTYWLNRDRHAQAYRTLLGTQSQEIVERLHGGAGNFVPAHQDARCLACHTIPATVYDRAKWGTVDLGKPAVALREDGVSCEACHGAAARWVGPHTGETWQTPGNRKEKYQGTGMVWLNDLETRARVCTGCHVGAPTDRGNNVPIRTVDHSLIAAGHPRLNFEFAADLQNLPRHWVEKDLELPPPDNRRPAAFEARIWLLGQNVTALAALDLLRLRAKGVLLDGKPDKPPAWPEFAHFDCFACHRDLGHPSWRQQASGYYRGRTPGTLRWNGWSPSLPLRLVAQKSAAGDGTGRLGAALRQMSDLPYSDRERVAEAAEQAINRLEERLDRLRHPDSTPVAAHRVTTNPAGLSRAILDAFDFSADPADERDGLRPESLGWDDSTQFYLALAALDHARVDDRAGGDDQKVEELLRRLLGSLAFPRKPSRYDSPRDYRRSDLSGEEQRQVLEQVLQALKKR